MTSERPNGHHSLAGRSGRRLAPLAVAIAVTAAIILAAAATVAAESPAASGAAASTGSGGGSPAGGAAISIVQKTFQPSNVTIRVGDTVTWTVTQAISDPHSVTSGSYKDAQQAGKAFDSGITLKNNGDHFSHQFTTPGTYAFFCAVHPDTMSGTITVTDATGTPSGSGAEAGIPGSSKVIAAVVLIAALVILFGWARLYQRLNRA